MKVLLIIASAALLTSGASAFANSSSARFQEQQAWIEHGRNAGTITWREGRHLRREQAAIARTRLELEADGKLSRSDRRTLQDMQDRSQAHIAREAADGWRRPWWLPRFGR